MRSSKASPSCPRACSRTTWRADHLPLVLPVAGAQGLPRWAQVMVRLGDIDEVSLDIHGTVTARLDGGPDDKSTGESAEAPDDESDDDTLAGPIAIAVDLGEGDPAPGDNSAL